MIITLQQRVDTVLWECLLTLLNARLVLMNHALYTEEIPLVWGLQELAKGRWMVANCVVMFWKLTQK